MDSGSISWIKNLVEVKKEKERLLVNHQDFIINIDTKWRSHPPPLTTPREEWMNHPSTVDLYCLGICKQSGITCLRDLTSEHIPLLKAMMKEGLAAIKSTYGVDQDQIRVFIHYQPQFVSNCCYRVYYSIDSARCPHHNCLSYASSQQYHFHIHFTRLENEVGSNVDRGHLVSDVIQNLLMEDYYKKRTITIKLKKGTALEAIIRAYLEEHSE